MRHSMFDEKINLVKSLNGTYKESDKEMVVKVINAYKQRHHCSYKQAYEMNVEGNPSFSAYNAWRHKLSAKNNS